MDRQERSNISTKTAGLIVRDAIGEVERRMAKGEFDKPTPNGAKEKK